MAGSIPAESRAISTRIRQAIIPAAGFGTRLRPLTDSIPKEMLPIGRKPVLEHVVCELRAVGIDRILLVVSPHKDSIRRHFSTVSSPGADFEFIVQPEMRGLGDAVLLGEDWAGGEPFVVAFGDCIVSNASGVDPATESPIARMLSAHTAADSIATVLVEQIAPDRTRSYGIVAPAADSDETIRNSFALSDIVEKPDPADAPSRFAIAARWIVTPRVFDHLRRAQNDRAGEINLTDPIREMMRATAGQRSAWAVPLRPGEARLDIGNWRSYLRAAAVAALEDDEFGSSIRAELCAAAEDNGEPL